MKQKPTDTLIRSALAAVFLGEATTQAERAGVVLDWRAGGREFVRLAADRRLSPIALLAGSLVDSEDPLYAPFGNLCTRTLLEFVALVVLVDRLRVSGLDGGLPEAEVVKIAMEILSPVDNSPKPVDKWLKTVDKVVDKVVDNPVDKIGSYPQFLEISRIPEIYPHLPVVINKLSTGGCG